MKKIFQIILGILFGLIEWLISGLPGPLGSKLRYTYWCCRLKSIGKHVKFGVGVRIYGPKYLSIGNNCWIDDYVLITAGPSQENRRNIVHNENPDFHLNIGDISIGDNVHIAPFVVLQGHGGISIGENLTIASGSKVYSLVHHYRNEERESTTDVIYKFVGLVSPEEQSVICSPIVIHDNAAVGLNSVILPGSVIGKNSWLGAQSLLKGSLPENVIAYGNPAKIVKNRFDK